LLLLYPGSARSFADELHEEDWEIVETRQIFGEICLQLAEAGQPDPAVLLESLPQELEEWLQAVLKQQAALPPMDDKKLLAERFKVIKDMRARGSRLRYESLTKVMPDLEAPDGDGTALAQVIQQVNRELPHIEVNERLSGRARVRPA
jgi:hypothetical protein